MPAVNDRLNVVLFTGGRGSSVLSRELIRSAGINLTLAINGYDDGLSTGEVRRFLGDCLGPSDFRKNAGRLAAELATAAPEFIQLLDFRLPRGTTPESAAPLLRVVGGAPSPAGAAAARRLGELCAALDPRDRHAAGARLALFEAEREATGRAFEFGDCSIGNLVFAGCFLAAGRDFNAAVEDYCALLDLPRGIIQNVTDGQNLWLVAVTQEGRLVATEAEIVDTREPQFLREIHLLRHPPTAAEREAAAAPEGLARLLEQLGTTPVANPALLADLERADLIVYAPGTQHSSLYPTYLTPGVGETIARNLQAMKILITNLQEDAEIAGESAVELVGKALYYLREKGRSSVPAPCLVTHYLMNQPGRAEPGTPYVPLGALESLEDPRMVRIGNYEDGVTGRHDAARVLTPFVLSLLRRNEPMRAAVLLLDGGSLNKIGQTILEVVRAGAESTPVELTVFYESIESFSEEFARSLPFELRNLATRGSDRAEALARIAADRAFDYVVLFESSGMYKGEDILTVTAPLHNGRLDAVWGSRRLSTADIRQAYRLIYRHRNLRYVASYAGSHLLSLAYLSLFGRYISDTLSGVRAVRSSRLRAVAGFADRREFNQIVLSHLLREGAEVVEAPVYYFPISPDRVRRTTVLDGLRGLGAILAGRWGPRRQAPAADAADQPEPLTASRWRASLAPLRK